MSTATGTTPTTRMMLDFMSVVMFATSQASTKLCHCGFVGIEKPAGEEPWGCSAADSIESRGKTEKRAAPPSRRVLGVESLSRVSTGLTSP